MPYIAILDGDAMRWLLGAVAATVLAVVGWAWKASARTTTIEASAVTALDVARGAHGRLDALAPRVSALEVNEAGDREITTALCERVDEIRDDLKELLRRTSKS